ncbi:MAG: hypothetical protein QM820_34480 [Minicystis sp.]
MLGAVENPYRVPLRSPSTCTRVAPSAPPVFAAARTRAKAASASSDKRWVKSAINSAFVSFRPW